MKIKIGCLGSSSSKGVFNSFWDTHLVDISHVSKGTLVKSNDGNWIKPLINNKDYNFPNKFIIDVDLYEFDNLRCVLSSEHIYFAQSIEELGISNTGGHLTLIYNDGVIIFVTENLIIINFVDFNNEKISFGFDLWGSEKFIFKDFKVTFFDKLDSIFDNLDSKWNHDFKLLKINNSIDCFKNLVNAIIILDFNRISNFKFPLDTPFGLVIIKENVKYEFFMNLKSTSEKIIILGSGALPQSSEFNRLHPLFQRWSWNDKFEDSTIYYNDPTLYIDDELLGGWGIGTKEDYYLNNISEIIVLISKYLKLDNENLLFYGSSAGGFMSIMLSTLVKGSSALADIPQFNLINYFPYHWNAFKKHIFKEMDEKLILEKFSYRLNVIDMFKKENYVPNLILILDFSVEHDVNTQYIPFLNKLNEITYDDTYKIKIIVNWKNEGHSPLNYNKTINLINNFNYY